MDRLFQQWRDAGLIWLPERGMGHYPVRAEDEPYDAAYFQKYQGYAETEQGAAITRARVALVNAHTAGDVLDIGIGCGAFVEARGSRTYGYDINPAAVAWLRTRGLYGDPMDRPVEALTLWDSLEHLPNPASVVLQATRYVFASVPVVRDAERLATWKHFRRDEHRWYWTRDGLVRWMRALGFRMLAASDMEARLGREDIETFVFHRMEDAA